MVFVRSADMGCTYTLDPDHNAVLYFHPIYADGSIETCFSAYAEVEWEYLDDEGIACAERAEAALKEELGELAYRA